MNGSAGFDLVKRLALIGEMIARGHDVHVSSPVISDAQRSALTGAGATVHEVDLMRTGQNMVQDVRYALSLARLTRTLRPDHVLGFTIKPNVWGTMTGARYGARCAMVITGLGYVFLKRRHVVHGAVQAIARGLYRMATAKAEAVVFQNPDDLAQFVSAGCLGDPAKAFVINGSGVDVRAFRPEPLPGDPVYLMLTRLLRAKGIDDYADAASIVRDRIPDARFLLAGPLDTGPDAFSDTEVHSWRDRGLEYLGSFDDVRPAIARCSIFVLPSWREGTPRSVLEAMAMGRPVITTDAPGCRETVVDGVNGLLVPVHNPDALARAMEKFAADPHMRQAMGREGRRIAEDRYAVEKVNAVLLDRIGL